MRANRETLSKALGAAVPKSLPVCVSFLFLALSYGVLMGTKGFSFVWPMCMSAFIFTGSMEFVTVNLLLSAFNPIAAFLLAIMIGARHIFYGISMLGKYRNMGVKKFYLVYGLCDETFAVNSGAKIPQGVDHSWFYCFVTLLNQFYWVLGATLGGLLGERLSSLNTNGLEFILTGLFVVVFLDQYKFGAQKPYGGPAGHCDPGDLPDVVRPRRVHGSLAGRHARTVPCVAAVSGRSQTGGWD